MSRATDRLADHAARKRRVWSRPDFDAGYEAGSADMFKTFTDALTAHGIDATFTPHLELRNGRGVLLFKAILVLPAKPNPPILP